MNVALRTVHGAPRPAGGEREASWHAAEALGERAASAGAVGDQELHVTQRAADLRECE